MKKVWTEIKFEFAYTVAEMWYFVNKYILKHSNSFSETIMEFAWNRHAHWCKRFFSLYEELELPNNE